MIFQAIRKAKLYHLLFLIDTDLAEQQKEKNCPFCGSVLHYSNYLRKPRGGPENLPEELSLRYSLCCSKETCRRRVLPISCRFWDRRVYWNVAILVVCALYQNRTDGYSAANLKRLLGVSCRTLMRWIAYFKHRFPFSERWQRIKGYLSDGGLNGALPGAVIRFFISRFESAEKGLILSVRFLSGAFDPF